MSARQTITRRTLLKGIGSSLAMLPFYRLVESSVVEAATPPLRFVAMYNPHGTVFDYWRPQGTETNFSLEFPGSILAPLQRYQRPDSQIRDFRSKICVLDGLDYRVLYEKTETSHEGALVTFLTGSQCLGSGYESVPEGQSLDQYLAAQIGGQTRFRSLELGVYKPAGDSAMTTMCYGPGGRRLPNLIDPLKVYQRLFGALAPSSGELTRALQRKKSVLDFVLADVNRLRSRVAGPEKEKLDRHFEALRDIERRMFLPAFNCSVPAAPAPLNAQAIENVPAILQLQMDFILLAFQCDLTRVVTLQCLSSGSDTPMPWVEGLNRDVHVLAHETGAGGAAGAEARSWLATAQRWYAQQFASLLDRLDSNADGPGTLLDNTVLLWGNELGDPAVHDSVNIPMVLAGGGSRFRLGRHLRYSLSRHASCELTDRCTPDKRYSLQTPHNGVLTSICQAFGLPNTHFGDPDYPGVLPNLV